jgi:hypothetical protein
MEFECSLTSSQDPATCQLLQPNPSSPFHLSNTLFNVIHQPIHISWVPFHHATARPQVADGGNDLQIRSAAANALKKHSRANNKGFSSSLSVGRGEEQRNTVYWTGIHFVKRTPYWGACRADSCLAVNFSIWGTGTVGERRENGTSAVGSLYRRTGKTRLSDGTN